MEQMHAGASGCRTGVLGHPRGCFFVKGAVAEAAVGMPTGRLASQLRDPVPIAVLASCNTSNPKPELRMIVVEIYVFP
jgi:hypothetical protein